MRVFLTGSQGVGKSSISEKLVSTYDFVAFDSRSKKFIKPENKNVQTDFDSSEFLKFQKLIYQFCLNEYLFERNSKNIIFSRSIVDSYAYIKYAFDKTRDHVNKIQLGHLLEDINIYRDLIEGTYFYIPIEFQITEKGNHLRALDEKYQKEIDILIKEYLDNSKISYITLTGSIDERVQQIMKEVK